MAAKSDPQNLASDSGLQQCQSLLELSSGPPGIVPSPRIAIAQMTQSKHTISVAYPKAFFFAYGIGTG